MLTVEKCIEVLGEAVFEHSINPQKNIKSISALLSNKWDRQFIENVEWYIINKNKISTGQASIALKLIDRYRNILIEMGISEQDINELLRTPKFVNEPYQSREIKREVRYAGNNMLVFRMKANQDMIEKLKRLGRVRNLGTFTRAQFNSEYAVWCVRATDENKDEVMNFIRRFRFDFDNDVVKYFLNCTNAKGETSEVEIKDGFIEVTIRDDDFLDSMINLLVQE